MANHGFQLTGSHGIFQIDGTHQNMCLADAFSMQGTGGRVYYGGDIDTGYTAKFPPIITNSNSIIAMDCDNWVGIFDDSMVQPIGAGKVNTKIYVFSDKPHNWYQSNMGLSIRNDKNVEVYNSNWATMKIVDVFHLGINYIKSWNYKIPVGKKYAFAIFGGGHEVSISHYDGKTSYYFWRRVGNLFEINFMTYSEFLSAARNMYKFIKSPMSIIVVDVTDI